MRVEFNDNWILTKGNGEEKIVQLPHDAMIEEKRYENCVNGKQCAFFPGGKYVYRKSFNVAKENLQIYRSTV